MRNISVVGISLSDLEFPIFIDIMSILAVGLVRHLCKEITLGYMNVSTVAPKS